MLKPDTLHMAVQKHVNVFTLISLTIDGWRQQRGHNLALAFLVLVEETLEAVKDGTAKHEGLPLVHHGH